MDSVYLNFPNTRIGIWIYSGIFDMSKYIRPIVPYSTIVVNEKNPIGYIPGAGGEMVWGRGTKFGEFPAKVSVGSGCSLFGGFLEIHGFLQEEAQVSAQKICCLSLKMPLPSTLINTEAWAILSGTSSGKMWIHEWISHASALASVLGRGVEENAPDLQCINGNPWNNFQVSKILERGSNLMAPQRGTYH